MSTKQMPHYLCPTLKLLSDYVQFVKKYLLFCNNYAIILDFSCIYSMIKCIMFF